MDASLFNLVSSLQLDALTFGCKSPAFCPKAPSFLSFCRVQRAKGFNLLFFISGHRWGFFILWFWIFALRLWFLISQFVVWNLYRLLRNFCGNSVCLLWHSLEMRPGTLQCHLFSWAHSGVLSALFSGKKNRLRFCWSYLSIGKIRYGLGFCNAFKDVFFLYGAFDSFRRERGISSADPKKWGPQ